MKKTFCLFYIFNEEKSTAAINITKRIKICLNGKQIYWNIASWYEIDALKSLPRLACWSPMGRWLDTSALNHDFLAKNVFHYCVYEFKLVNFNFS